MAPLYQSLYALLGSIAVVSALKVAAGSSCAAFCIDDPNGNGFDPSASSTNTTDMVCQDIDYSTTAQGIKYKQCQECLQKSTKVNGTETDLNWYLYNLRYNIDTCLFDTPAPPTTAVNSPCLINYACLPLKNVLVSSLNDTTDTYGYCSSNGSNFAGNFLNACISCLQSSSNQIYMANFLTALEAGCEQKPAPGNTIEITGDVFSTAAVNITAPPPSQSTAATGPVASSSTMTMGTIVGIAVGAALLFLGGTALFVVYWRRQKKFNRDMKLDKDFQPRSGTSSMSASRQAGSYIPLSTHQKSNSVHSVSYQGSTHPDQFDYSNSNYYDKIEEEMRTRNYNFDPHKVGSHGPGSAIPTHPAYIPRAMSRQSRNPSPKPQPKAAPEPMPAPTSNLAPAVAVPRKTTPPPLRLNKQPAEGPSSYALQQYLKTSDDVSAAAAGGIITIAPPPPNPPQAAVVASYAGPSVQAVQPPPPPPPAGSSSLLPPPPPRQSKIPSLVMPVVPRLRMPKKYSPPRIVVEGATPVDGNDDRGRITLPLSLRDQRFPDRPLQGGSVLADRAPERDDSDYDREIPIGSGKSTLYGY